MTRCLLISLLLFTGCASVTPASTSPGADISCIEKFIPDLRSQWYRSTIDVRGRHFSGLMLFKTMPDSSMRVVFTNEAGVKFFDYEFNRNGDFKVIESIKPLRRKVVIKLLRRDLALITMMKVRSGNATVATPGGSVAYSFGTSKDLNRFTLNRDCSHLTSIERLEGGNVRASAKIFGDHIDAPDSIFVSHLNFEMELELRRLKRN